MGASAFDGTIEITNWERYNPRSDVKATNWLRLQNSLFEDPNFVEFSHSELLFWIYLLSLGSKKSSGKIKLSLTHAKRIGQFSEAHITSALQKLIDLGCVQVNSALPLTPNADVTPTLRARDADVPLRDGTGRDGTERNGTENFAQGSPTPDAPAEEFADGEKTPPGAVVLTTKPEEGPTATALTWRSYRDAYEKKYGEAPPFNAKIGGQLRSFVSRVPKEEAPLIAAFYLTHHDGYYVKSMHPVGLLLRDAEKLRTEWVTGRKMTGAVAKQSEQREGNVEAMKDYLATKGVSYGG